MGELFSLLEDFEMKQKLWVDFIADNLGQYHAWLRERAEKDKAEATGAAQTCKQTKPK